MCLYIYIYVTFHHFTYIHLASRIPLLFKCCLTLFFHWKIILLLFFFLIWKKTAFSITFSDVDKRCTRLAVLRTYPIIIPSTSCIIWFAYLLLMYNFNLITLKNFDPIFFIQIYNFSIPYKHINLLFFEATKKEFWVFILFCLIFKSHSLKTFSLVKIN